MNDTPVLIKCADCRYCEKDTVSMGTRCYHPKSEWDLNWVTNEKTYHTANFMREDNLTGCGRDATLFQPKP